MVVVAIVVLTGTDAWIAADLTAAFPIQAGTMIEAAGIRTSPQPVVNDVATGRAALADLGPAPEG